MTNTSAAPIPSSPSPGRGRLRHVVLGCLLGSLCVTCGVGSCLGLAGGGACFAWRKLDAPARRAEAFLAALEAEDLPGAYQLMSPSYRREADLAAFEHSLQPTLSALRGGEHRLGARQINASSAQVAGVIQNDADTSKFTISLRQVEEQWFVTGLELQGMHGP